MHAYIVQDMQRSPEARRQGDNSNLSAETGILPERGVPE